MWPLLRDCVTASIVVSLDDAAAAMKLVGRTRHVITEGAGGMRRRRGAVWRAARGKIVAVVSGGNIDLAKFRVAGRRLFRTSLSP